MTTLSQLTREQLKENIEWFGERLASDLEEARILYEDMKNNELSIGTAEAEGSLRAHIMILNTFHQIIYGGDK
jgi:hypothetical protein